MKVIKVEDLENAFKNSLNEIVNNLFVNGKEVACCGDHYKVENISKILDKFKNKSFDIGWQPMTNDIRKTLIEGNKYLIEEKDGSQHFIYYMDDWFKELDCSFGIPIRQVKRILIITEG